MKSERNPLRNKSVVTIIKASFTKKKVSYVLKNVVEKQEIQTRETCFVSFCWKQVVNNFKKVWRPKFGANRSKLGPKLGFLPFSQVLLFSFS